MPKCITMHPELILIKYGEVNRLGMAATERKKKKAYCYSSQEAGAFHGLQDHTKKHLGQLGAERRRGNYEAQ